MAIVYEDDETMRPRVDSEGDMLKAEAEGQPLQGQDLDSIR